MAEPLQPWESGGCRQCEAGMVPRCWTHKEAGILACTVASPFPCPSVVLSLGPAGSLPSVPDRPGDLSLKPANIFLASLGNEIVLNICIGLF